MARYLLTQTLVSSFHYAVKTDNGYKDFLNTLNRIPLQPTQAMLNGIQFEEMVRATSEGYEPNTDHEWYKPVCEIASTIKGGVYQPSLYREITVDNDTFLIHGKLDWLKAGTIYDCKFSARYGKNGKTNKYLSSPQTPFYFYLAPGAREFIYLISDGEYVYKERYTPDEVASMEQLIRPFGQFLKAHNLVGIYAEKWRAQ